jgi:hypothetical protein
MRIDHYIHFADQDEIIRLLRRILANQAQELANQEIEMATLDQVLADVTDESTQIDSLSTLTAGIKAQLDAILAGSLTPDQQAKVDAVFAGIEANKAKVVAAINANSPPAPAPTT